MTVQISVLHDFDAVAKTARAAIPRDEFECAVVPEFPQTIRFAIEKHPSAAT